MPNYTGRLSDVKYEFLLVRCAAFSLTKSSRRMTIQFERLRRFGPRQ